MLAGTLATNAFWALICHMLSRGSLMLAAILLARAFEPTSFAAYAYFQLTISMLASYAAIGLGVAASRLFAEIRATDRRGSTPPIGSLVAISAAMAGTVALAIVFTPDTILSGELRIPRWLVALGAMVLAVQAVPSGAVLGLELYRNAALVATISAFVTLVGAVWAAYAGQVALAMLSLIAAALVQLWGDCWIIVRYLGWTQIKRCLYPQRAQIGRIFRISSPMFLVSVLFASAAWLVGRIVLEGPGGQLSFSIFAIGLQWLSLGLVIPGMLARVVLPLLVRLSPHSGNGALSRQLVRTSTLMATGAALSIALSGFVFKDLLVSLYGDMYRSSELVLVSFLFVAILGAPVSTLGNTLVANDGQWAWLLLMIVWWTILLATALALREQELWVGPATYALAYGALTVGALLVTWRRALI